MIFNQKLRFIQILLVDDDVSIRDAMTLFFNSCGCSLLAVESAEAGMDALRKKTYEVIISDYRLPGMDGIEFFRQVKTEFPDVKKILITAYADEVKRSEKLTHTDALIPKPFTSKVVINTLMQLIRS